MKTAKKSSRRGRSIRSPRVGAKVGKPIYPTADELNTIKQAAVALGQSDSGFIVNAALKEAKKVLKQK